MQIETCPHCGGTAFLQQIYSYRCRCYFISVKCDICGASGKAYTQKEAASDQNWESISCMDAVRAWNMRTPAGADTQKGQGEDGQQSD